MTGTGRARVEFLDPTDDLVAPGHRAAGDLHGDSHTDPHGAGHGSPSGHAGLGWFLPAAVVLCGVGVAARLISAPAPPTAPTPPLLPVFSGSVALPEGFGAPVALTAATSGDADVLWVRSASGRVARVVDGAVSRVSQAAGYRAIAVRPDGGMLYAATGTSAPAVVAIDPQSLVPTARALSPAPVSALAAGTATVWAATPTSVQAWTSDLSHPLLSLAVPAEVSAVHSLAVAGLDVQATVSTTSGLTALLRLTAPAGAARLTAAYPGPVSIVPGDPALVAHLDPGRYVQVLRDPSAPGLAAIGGPQFENATIWPATRTGTATWLVSSPTTPTLDCHDVEGALVGRATVGDDGTGVKGPVVTTADAVYAVTVDGRLSRGGHASCGVPPASRYGGRPGGVVSGGPGERVEFVERTVVPAGADDEIVTGGDAPRPRGWTLLAVAGAVVVLVVAVLVGRLHGDDATPAAVSPSVAVRARPTNTATGPPVFGLVGLPQAISEPSALVAAGYGDVVWMLDRGAGVVRIEGGHVTRVQLLEAQATAIAVSPDGGRLYVATTGDRPELRELDATTLALGPVVSLARTVQAMTASSDAVWAAQSGQLLRLDLDRLGTLATVALPGTVVTTGLRVGHELTGSDEVLTGLVTGTDGGGTVGTRPLRLDPVSEAVTYGPARPGEVQTASSESLYWLSWTPTGGSGPSTEGYGSAADVDAQASAVPALPAGSRLYDGGPGRDGLLTVAPSSSVIGCRDGEGSPTSEVDVAPAVPGAVITGPVLSTDTAFYAATDRGLVRTGLGACT